MSYNSKHNSWPIFFCCQISNQFYMSFSSNLRMVQMTLITILLCFSSLFVLSLLCQPLSLSFSLLHFLFLSFQFLPTFHSCFHSFNSFPYIFSLFLSSHIFSSFFLFLLCFFFYFYLLSFYFSASHFLSFPPSSLILSPFSILSFFFMFYFCLCISSPSFFHFSLSSLQPFSLSDPHFPLFSLSHSACLHFLSSFLFSIFSFFLSYSVSVYFLSFPLPFHLSLQLLFLVS